MHTLIISEADKAQFVYLFFTEEKATLKIKENYFQMDCNAYGRKTMYFKSNLESYNLYFYHIRNVTSYFGYVFKLLL